MQKDEMIQMLADWVKQHPRPREALLPQNLSQALLDILVTDTKEMIDQAGESRPQANPIITAACLLLLAQVQDTKKVQVSEQALSQAIFRLTHAIHLESLRRRGVIKALHPEFQLTNIFDEQTRYNFEITELGKQMQRESERLTNLH